MVTRVAAGPHVRIFTRFHTYPNIKHLTLGSQDLPCYHGIRFVVAQSHPSYLHNGKGLSRKGEFHPLALSVAWRALLEAPRFTVLKKTGGLFYIPSGTIAVVVLGWLPEISLGWQPMCNELIVPDFFHTWNLITIAYTYTYIIFLLCYIKFCVILFKSRKSSRFYCSCLLRVLIKIDMEVMEGLFIK